MRTYHDGYKDLPERMLFNIEEDPYEQHDLAAARPEILNEGMARLEAWTARMLETSSEPVDPMQVVIAEGGPLHTREADLARYCERLRSTGRAGCAEKLWARHGERARRRG